MITHAEETIINAEGQHEKVLVPLRYEDAMKGSEELVEVINNITNGHRPGGKIA